MWQVRQWPPFCFGSIILASDKDWFINDSEVSNGDSSSSWVTVNLGIGSNLLDIRHSKPSFFFQLPDGALFRRLIHIHEAAGESPASFERFIASLISNRTFGSASLSLQCSQPSLLVLDICRYMPYYSCFFLFLLYGLKSKSSSCICSFVTFPSRSWRSSSCLGCPMVKRYNDKTSIRCLYRISSILIG